MKTVLLVFLLIMVPPVCRAATVPELYVGEALVADQGLVEQKRALPLALEHVLQKLSGLRQFDEYPLVQPALEQAPEIVLSYYYRKVERTAADGSENEELHLIARFSEAAVDEMVRALRLPLWVPQRAPMVAWLIIDDGLGRRIMPVEFGDARQSMEEIAERRGLPLTWPSPDAEGRYAVDDQILWGGYTEDLAVPQGQGVLIAAARREGPEWSVRINVGYQDRHWSWRLNDLDLSMALEAGMQQAIDQVVSVNTILASDLGVSQRELRVAGLASAADYRRCLGYLQNISLVDSVAVVAAKPGVVTFRLVLNALPRYLDEMLDSGGVLERSEDGDSYLLVGVPHGEG